MAKAKKSKNNEGSKPDTASSEAIVLHQKLCLSIDLINRRIYGYTELEIAVPDNGVIGLYAENLEIESVYVDGEPADFDVYPHYQPVEIENRWCSVSSVDSAADAAGVTYISGLERELVPNLLILCRKSMARGNQQQSEAPLENGGLSNGEVKQNVKLIRIDYWVEKAEAGVHFDDKVLHTNSQIRRAHCWFPCMDDSLQRCCYDLEFTVPHNFVAVSNGTLLYQVLSKDDPPRKTFVYKLNIPVSARWISLAVAPFEILPDCHNNLLSHMCLAGSLPKLQNTVNFFHSAFRHYETYLESLFPFGSYKQVFIAPEMVISSVTMGASMTVFSSHILFDEKVIDQTIVTRIKLLYALARQWFGVYITPETSNDEWLVEGLAGFLTDTFVKEFLGNNEARYRKYKANCAVCKADDSGATTLSPSSSPKVLYGTQFIGLYGRIRSWKSVAILQMLEKQMGPDLFRGILRAIVSRAQENAQSLRTLSTKEFRHYANKLGNLERPFLKEFFNRWVETSGCPVLRMGFSYNKRKNMVELAAVRECTAVSNTVTPGSTRNVDSENHGDSGWPGMMTIKVHELDGTHDHLLPMSGDAWQLLEIKCHSRLATKRFQKPKKGSKPDGSDDNGEPAVALDMRSSAESPLLWVRTDPEMEYLAEIHFNQPVQMWINQLEKDRDVVAQSQAIVTLEELSNAPFHIINALTNFVADSKAFWRVRIEAAFALANIASEDSDWAGMLNLIKYYRAKRFDPSTGLPKPNDFHDLAEYFVLEAIPYAVATVRTVDNKSPREAVEFVLQVLKYNDNSGNPFSDVFWLAALVEAVGELEFGQQGLSSLSSLLKRIDRLLQFDRLMPSYNGILTVRCIRTLTQMALKLSEFITLDRVLDLIKPFQDWRAFWPVRIEASKALLDIEYHSKGIDAALVLFMKYLEEEPTLRGQAKLGIHMIRLSQITAVSGSNDDVKSQTLVALLRLLESRLAFRNVFLRHHLFCILQVLAGRRPTLYTIPRDHMRQIGYAEICSEQRNNFLAFINQIKPVDPCVDIHSPFREGLDQETVKITDSIGNGQEQNLQIEEPLKSVEPLTSIQMDTLPVQTEVFAHGQVENMVIHEAPIDVGLETISCSQINDMSVQADTIAYNVEQNPQAQASTKDNAPVQVDAFANSQEPNIQAREACNDIVTISSCEIEKDPAQADAIANSIEQNLQVHGTAIDVDTISSTLVGKLPVEEALNEVISSGAHTNSNNAMNKMLESEIPKEADSVSTNRERRLPTVKIRVKQTATNSNLERSQTSYKQVKPAASSSVSVDAPDRNLTEAVSVSNHVVEEVNSCQGRGSHLTASIGSAVMAAREVNEVGRDLQCTADSSNIPQIDNHSPHFPRETELLNAGVQQHEPIMVEDVDRGSMSTANRELQGKHKEKKEKKRKRDDPEYLEKKRLKKEKKQKKKDAKLLEERKVASGEASVRSIPLKEDNRPTPSDVNMVSKMDHDRQRPSDHGTPVESRLPKGSDGLGNIESNLRLMPNDNNGLRRLTPSDNNGLRLSIKTQDTKPQAPKGGTGTKLRIKIKKSNA